MRLPGRDDEFDLPTRARAYGLTESRNPSKKITEDYVWENAYLVLGPALPPEGDCVPGARPGAAAGKKGGSLLLSAGFAEAALHHQARAVWTGSRTRSGSDKW